MKNNSRDRRRERKETALGRTSDRAGRTTEEQLQRLSEAPGASQRERARLTPALSPEVEAG